MHLLVSLVIVSSLLVPLQAAAQVHADDDALQPARELMQQQRYQEAYEFLDSLPPAAAPASVYKLALAEAALETGRAEQARQLYEELLTAQPDSFEAHLGLGRAYLALGEDARARMELEGVLHLEDLPPDLQGQAEAYAEAAERYARGERLLPSAHVQLDGGRYSPDHGRGEYLGDLAAGAGLLYQLNPVYSFNANLQGNQRFNADSGNTNGVRGTLAVNRSVGKDQWRLEIRSRYRRDGGGYHHDDHAASLQWQHEVDTDNQFTLAGTYTRANFPDEMLGQLNRNHQAGAFSLGYEHSLADGQTSFSVDTMFGREWARGNLGIDGDADFHGVSAQFESALGENVSAWIGGEWRHNAFSQLRANDDASELVRRSDDLYELFAGLSWSLPHDWSLLPEILYLRDRGNLASNYYSSTEISLGLRKDW